MRNAHRWCPLTGGRGRTKNTVSLPLSASSWGAAHTSLVSASCGAMVAHMWNLILSSRPLYLFLRKNWIRSHSCPWYCCPQGKTPWLLCGGGRWVLFKGGRHVCPQMCANHTRTCVFAIFFPDLGPDRIHLHRDHHGMLPVWRPLLFWVCELQCVCGDRSLADSVQSQPSHENPPDQLEPDSEF